MQVVNDLRIQPIPLLKFRVGMFMNPHAHARGGLL